MRQHQSLIGRMGEGALRAITAICCGPSGQPRIKGTHPSGGEGSVASSRSQGTATRSLDTCGHLRAHLSGAPAHPLGVTLSEARERLSGSWLHTPSHEKEKVESSPWSQKLRNTLTKLLPILECPPPCSLSLLLSLASALSLSHVFPFASSQPAKVTNHVNCWEPENSHSCFLPADCGPFTLKSCHLISEMLRTKVIPTEALSALRPRESLQPPEVCSHRGASPAPPPE